jgi:hypothetical protein
MSRYVEPIPAPPTKKSSVPFGAGRPHRAEPQRGALWHAIQLKAAQDSAAAPRARSQSGLPGALKAGVEQLSGLAMDDVRVHRNSPEPARLGALAYAQGSDIHLGPGQERYLPHEAWHVVQQKQGRVQATAQMKGVGVNDDKSLEAEADRMGKQLSAAPGTLRVLAAKTMGSPLIQAKKGPAVKSLDYESMKSLVAANNQSGLSDELIIAQAYKESRFKTGAKSTSSSATGLLGITKTAVTEVNRVKKTSYKHSEMSTGATNLKVGTLYLSICVDRKGTTAAALDYYGTGPGYSTNIIAAETALKAAPADPMAELTRIIGLP